MVLIQIILFFDSQVSGRSRVVGIIIFSIVGGLDFGHNLPHMYLTLLLKGKVQSLPRMLQTLIR